MNAPDILMTVLAVLGGLALFLLGMSLMTEGLQLAAGSGLRRVLRRVGRSRATGLGLGVLLGFLVQSSAATVMLVAFVNGGFMAMAETVPAIIGANVGTTLSMQLISLDVGAYCYGVIAVGLLVRSVWPGPRVRQAGRAVMGFGLLLLGMTVMSDAVHPYREELQAFLAGSDARTLRGMLFGIGVSTLVTSVIQSSGATIGMCFALASAGAFEGLANVYPIVLGAHIGTCATAFLGSLGTHIEARRTAFVHLGFNLVGVALAVAAAPLLLAVVERTSGDLVRQTANLHSLVMVLAAAAVLPWSAQFARLVQWATPSAQAPPEPSFLNPELLPAPENAIQAVVRELRRAAHRSAESLELAAEMMLMRTPRRIVRRVEVNERTLNDIKREMREFLTVLARRHLSRRQSILIQHLDRCVVELERIGDHVAEVGALSLRRKKVPEAALTQVSMDALFALYEAVRGVLRRVEQSLDADAERFEQMAAEILAARDRYADLSLRAQDMFMEKLQAREETPVAGIYFSAYRACFDRIVRHAKTIALAEGQPDFWIKRQKLMRPEGAPAPKPAEPADSLHQLKMEDRI
jgi:phosphate:Na+ symporter